MRWKVKQFLLVWYIIGFFFVTVDKINVFASEEYSPEALLGFVKHLYKNQEYYRALVEFDRLTTYWPTFFPSTNASIVRLHLLFKGKQFDAILTEPIGSEDPYRCAAMIYRYDALLQKENIFNLQFLTKPKTECEDFFRPFFWKRDFLYAVITKDEKKAHELLTETFFPNELLGEKELFVNIFKKAEQQREAKTNPYVALFSGVIPGLGYYVGGNRATGIAACAVVSIFSALTVAAFKTNNEQIGIMFGMATFFFYGGSILGGYLQTKRNNVQLEKMLQQSVIEDAELEQDREHLFNKYGFLP